MMNLNANGKHQSRAIKLADEEGEADNAENGAAESSIQMVQDSDQLEMEAQFQILKDQLDAADAGTNTSDRVRRLLDKNEAFYAEARRVREQSFRT